MSCVPHGRSVRGGEEWAEPSGGAQGQAGRERCGHSTSGLSPAANGHTPPGRCAAASLDRTTEEKSETEETVKKVLIPK